ncbi:hypothetical protein D9C73_017460 [Collichthys lucidus]|uniref:Uncharacterized protein n=1 Tax=Collichthys lucidus TaxID=240159 RepID=A0A4U5V6U2_COLLU|nr:hypothetical protein D9C73_017460 [Collichthys lucidus]
MVSFKFTLLALLSIGFIALVKSEARESKERECEVEEVDAEELDVEDFDAEVSRSVLLFYVPYAVTKSNAVHRIHSFRIFGREGCPTNRADFRPADMVSFKFTLLALLAIGFIVLSVAQDAEEEEEEVSKEVGEYAFPARGTFTASAKGGVNTTDQAPIAKSAVNSTEAKP